MGDISSGVEDKVKYQIPKTRTSDIDLNKNTYLGGEWEVPL